MGTKADAALQEAIEQHLRMVDLVEPIRRKAIDKLAGAIDSLTLKPNETGGKDLEGQMSLFSTLDALLKSHAGEREAVAKLASHRRADELDSESRQIVAEFLRKIQTQRPSTGEQPRVALDTIDQMHKQADNEIAARVKHECPAILPDELAIDQVSEVGTLNLPADPNPKSGPDTKD